VLSDDHGDTDHDRVSDLARYPELVSLGRLHMVPGVLLAIGLYLLGSWPALVWGFFVSTVLTWHATFAINSLTHLFGRRRFRTRDDSRNSLLLALATLGEGWHNNHHYYKASTRQGFHWWEVDVTYYVLRLLAAVGLVWDLKEPPPSLLARRRPGAELLDPLRRGRLAEVLEGGEPEVVAALLPQRVVP
jgi:stearoyl-CoA desaturase (Delta-9 desaturase)